MSTIRAPGAGGSPPKVSVGAPAFFPAGAALAESPSPAVRTPRVETWTTQSTVRVPNGQTVVLAGASRPADGQQRVLLLTPHVLRLDGRK